MGCVGGVVLRLGGSLVESRPTLLHEPSLISLVPLIEECSWSLEVSRSWECVEDSASKPSSSFVQVAGSEYIVNQDLRSGG